MAKDWNIELNNLSLGGFAPGFYKETYPSYGNKNMAGSMLNADLTSPGFLTQGPGFANMTNGTQAGAVTTDILSILDFAVTASKTYGIGGAKLYELSSSTVTSSGTWPHTIDKGAVTAEDGEDVAYYQSNLYYSYNHSGSAGDIGKFNLDATFDDDWGSTVPSGAAALQSGNHQMIVGDNDVLYITNGRYIASYNGTTFSATALDLPTDMRAVSIQWMSDRLWIAAAAQPFSGGYTSTNRTRSSIFVWDGSADSWEAEIPVVGLIGGMYVKNGTLFLFHDDVTDGPITYNGSKLAYVDGSVIRDIVTFDGNVPHYGQITDYKDFLIWEAVGYIYAFGAGNKDLPARFFQLAGSANAGLIVGTHGALACPFGDLIFFTANTFDSTKNLLVQSGYTVTSNWKSLMFDITGGGRSSRINTVRINFEKLAANARVDWKLLNNQGTTLFSDTISHTKLGAVTSAWYNLNGLIAENFRLEFDYTNGNTTNPVKIKNAKIYGTSE